MEEKLFKYKDRNEAGKLLAQKLTAYSNEPKALVLALPRGGVPVAYEIAKALNLPLDIFLVRKLGAPRHPELAMGAIALGDVLILNKIIIKDLQISEPEIESVIVKEQQELVRRNIVYRHDKHFPEVKDGIIILVDDGIATGATMQAAITALRRLNPASIIVASPVAEPSAYEKIATEADKIYCNTIPSSFYSVGLWYENFAQLTDNEVCYYLEQTNKKI
jgi:putative phosphoribosyl transferase